MKKMLYEDKMIAHVKKKTEFWVSNIARMEANDRADKLNSTIREEVKEIAL